MEEETVAQPKHEGPLVEFTGSVVSEEDGSPIENVQVWVQDFPGKAVTDAAGVFTTELPTGKINISFIHKQFALLIKKDFEVPAGSAEPLTFKMAPKGLKLADFTVKAPHVAGGVAALIDQKRKASGVTEVLGSEEMKQNGDSNAAAALQRVTGLTVVGGRYVFVRGLGDRYITTLLNGLQLPSPEPEKRVIPLDIFPAGVLEQMTIAKTLSPDLPGAFGGGTILLKTKTLPEKDFLQIGAGAAYTERSTFNQGWSYDGVLWTFWGLTTVHGNCLRKWRRPRKKAPFCAAADGFPTRDFPTRSWPRWGKVSPTIGHKRRIRPCPT